MEVYFKTKKMAKTCSKEREVQKEYGQFASVLKRRLAGLRAAECLDDVPQTPPERRHLLTGDRKGMYAVDLSKNWRLVFKIEHDPVPKLDDEGVDTRKVTAIRIMEIGDYH